MTSYKDQVIRMRIQLEKLRHERDTLKAALIILERDYAEAMGALPDPHPREVVQ